MTRWDVAIVGGGIAGTSAAYFLAQDRSVVVLEAEATLGVHATGRSAAVFTECYGDPVVRRLAMASRSFLESPPEGFCDVAILGPRSILFIAAEDQVDRVETTADDFSAMVESVRAVTADEAIAMCPVLDGDVVRGGIYEPDARDLDVHALHSAFQRGLRARGGQIRTGFRVEHIRREHSGWRLRSGDDEVAATIVVDAAGAWCDVVAECAGVEPLGLVPKRRTAFSFRPPSDPSRWPMVVDLDERFYFKPEGQTVLASPADEMPLPPQDVRHREEDVALGIERISAVTTLSVRSIRNAWAGLRSFVADSRPVNGWDPAAAGFYWLAGQGGFGIKTSPAMGRFAAAMIATGEPPADLVAVGLDESALGADRLRH